MEQFEDRPHPEFQKGMQFIVVDNDGWANILSMGSVVTLCDQDDTNCPYFKLENGVVLSLLWSRFVPLEQNGATNSPLDTQVGGDHYKKMGDYQPWQVFEKWMTPEELKGFMKGTAIGYLSREQDKGGRQDIEKAMHTIQLYLQLTEEK